MSYDPIKEFAERQPRKILHRNWDEAHMKKLNRRLQLNARPPSWTRWTQVFSYVLCGGKPPEEAGEGGGRNLRIRVYFLYSDLSFTDASPISSLGITYYTVLHYDPGYSNHCYMPVGKGKARERERKDLYT